MASPFTWYFCKLHYPMLKAEGYRFGVVRPLFRQSIRSYQSNVVGCAV